ncbi:LamG-like jellyroll fold domain-containing protein [Turneriella parva]|uniref:LamG-like jellyroll fold domain-containing protein n=1 Tax=Turneriella parva TaxID=29510 RepID=UPI00145F6121|nr:LamG-like jellyroll fold domain-containing protein [Turneriella parva]
MNDKTACHKADVTRPQLAQAIFPVSGALISQLAYIDLRFSEELNDPQPSDFVLSDTGATGVNIVRVEKTAAFTYRLYTNQSQVSNGPIVLSFTNVRDYAGNRITGVTDVSYQGNVDIEIRLTTAPAVLSGISNTAGGYNQAGFAVEFTHDFVDDDGNSWSACVTSGEITCALGSGFSNGTMLASADKTIAPGSPVSLSRSPTQFSLGPNRLVIYVENFAKNKKGTNSWPIFRDDTPPLTSFTPPADAYATAQNIELTCSNNYERIIYTVASQQSTAPAPPPDPTFSATGQPILPAVLYTGPITTPSTPDPQVSIYKWRCIDRGGNVEPVVQSATYTIDSSIPAVTVNLDTSIFRPFVSPTVNNTSTLRFTTNLAAPATYRIVHNATSCTDAGATVLQPLTALPATAGIPVERILNTSSDLPSDGVYNVRICVQNLSAQWGFAFLQITRDSTAPTTAASPVGGSFGEPQSVALTCSDNPDRIVFTTNGDEPHFGMPASNTYSTPFQTPQGVTTLKYICRDKAGNNEASVKTQVYTVDSVLPTITVLSNTYAALSNTGSQTQTTISWTSSRPSAPYTVRLGGTSCTTGTQLASGTTEPTISSPTNTIVTEANLGSNGPHTIRICVQNLILAYGNTTLTLTRDTTPPTFAGLTSLTSGGSSNFTLQWSLADDTTGSGIAYYNIYRAEAVGGPYTTVNHIAAHPATSINVTVPVATNTYYYVAGAVDNAGNETKVTASPFATKPQIRLVVSGLDTANSKTFGFTDGTASGTISANSIAPGVVWVTTRGLGDTYNFAITAQPAGQVCAIRQGQFGTLLSDLTLNIDCANGYMVGGRFQAVAATNVPAMLYRTRAEFLQTSFAVLGELPNSLAVAGGFVFWGTDGDCDGGAPLSYCIYKTDVNNINARTLVASGIPGVIRGMATDGTSIYFTTLTDNRLYKVPVVGGARFEVASGFSNPFGIALDGDDIYVCNRAADELVKVDLRTGQKTTVVSGISAPIGIVVVGNDLYFTRAGVNAVYRVPKGGGTVVTAFGQTSAGHVDGVGSVVRLNEPHDLIYDGKGSLIFTEYGNHVVRRAYLATGQVTTLVGNSSMSSMFYTNGAGSSAGLPRPVGIATDGRNMYISLHGDRRIVKLFEDKLTGHWTFTNNSDDYSSDAAAVTPAWLGTATYTTGRFGEAAGAALFDGSRHVTTKNFTFTVNQPFTLSAWVRASDLSVARPIIGNLTDFEFQWYIAPNGSVTFQNWYSSGALTNYLSSTSAGVVKTNTWVHLTYVYRGGDTVHPGGRIYVNGYNMTAASSQASVDFLDSFVSNVTIGATRSQASRFAGSMADVRIYNRALSEGEINELAQDTGTSANIGPTELIAHYEMSGYTASGALAQNLLGGTTSAVGKDGDTAGAFSFNGTGSLSVDAATIAALPKENAPRTLCAFIRPLAYPPVSNFVSPVSYGGAGSGREFGLAISRDAGTNIFVANTFNSAFDHAVAYKFSLGTWAHVCATFDGTNARLYVDGALVGTKPVTLSTSVSSTVSGAFRVGAWFDDGHRFTGDVDDVRVYNKALSAAEIRQIAVQAPAGLVSRFDFTGDTADASGQGNTLTNAGATPTDDRFDLNSQAYKFDGSDSMSVAAGNHLVSDATFALWIRPSTIPAGLTGLIDNWNGDGSTAGAKGGGIVFNGPTALQVLARGNGAVNDCGVTYMPPAGTYRHIAATVRSGSTGNITIYVDGAAIRTCTPANLFPEFNNGVNFAIGKNIWPTGFDGNIDDVRIYNRALSATEVRALVQQPSRRIYVTANTYSGDLAGVTGADAKCNNVADVNKPPGVYKAMLVDDSVRRACTSASCATSGFLENIDWVLRPQVPYVDQAGTRYLFTANDRAVFSSVAIGGIAGSAVYPWTGLSSSWLVGSVISPTQDDCANWTPVGVNGFYGEGSNTGGGAISFNFGGCAFSRPLYCVEQ